MNVPVVMSYLPIELICLHFCVYMSYVKISLECYFKYRKSKTCIGDTHPSPSLRRTSLNKTADSVEIVSYNVSTVWKAWFLKLKFSCLMMFKPCILSNVNKNINKRSILFFSL